MAVRCQTSVQVQGWIQGGGWGGQPPPPPNPENQFENGTKFLCLKGKWRTISLFLHQKCYNVNSSGHLKIVIFNYLMLVDANCDDNVTIPRCPNMVVDLKVSVHVAHKKNVRALTRAFWAPPISNPGSTPAVSCARFHYTLFFILLLSGQSIAIVL